MVNFHVTGDKKIACVVWNNKLLFYKVQVQGKVFNKVLNW